MVVQGVLMGILSSYGGTKAFPGSSVAVLGIPSVVIRWIEVVRKCLNRLTIYVKLTRCVSINPQSGLKWGRLEGRHAGETVAVQWEKQRTCRSGQ
ncbi:hypothetical protein NPIL_622991 [Nephila pilipes]|uniref:Uncharacterized protein n=1 Tax=Nephila pilipes TaxID=299642 RepID=A0A8X6T8N1_NEPPI|nr:hypothetical protein NPIL_622991 [Nephila pilipes]